jgi:hypothetical protein
MDNAGELMNTEEEFFESLIEYIDAAIDAKQKDNDIYLGARLIDLKQQLKDSLSKLAAELFHGH